ncbi:hypothetical protein pb186bvf_009573 [Paramecium bursaria]
MQPEDQLVWLLQALQPYSSIYEAMYGVKFEIPNIIICKTGEPKQWFYMDKKFKIKQHSEEWLKWKVVQFYFRNKENMKIKKMIEQIQQDELDGEDPLSDETLFYIEQKLQPKGKIYRSVPSETGFDILKNPTEKFDMISNWTKIISSPKLERPKLMFIGLYLRQTPHDQPKFQFTRKRLSKQQLMKEEYVKSESIPKKPLNLKEEFDRSYASQQNQNCELFLKSLCRFIEGKGQRVLSRLEVEFFLTENDFKIFLTGLESIAFFNDEKKSEQIDLGNLDLKQKPAKDFSKCSGIYCRYATNNIYFDEADEQFSLYIMADEKQTQKFVAYKSIFIDLLERYKTIQLIKQNWQRSQDNVPEYLIFRLRRYYSISEVTSNIKFKHLKISNFYNQRKVCNYCYKVYEKLDTLRNRVLINDKKQQLKPEDIFKEVEKFYGQSQINRQALQSEKQQSEEFEMKLKEFDTEVQNFFKEFTITYKTDEKFFYKKKYGRHQIEGMGFQLPKVIKVEIKDKDNMIKRKKLFIPKDSAEALGLKHYLGHVNNLPHSDQGLAISKSSLELNKLQDKIREIQYLKEKMENEKIKKIREDIQIMLCTYYGKGKFEKDRLVDFIDTLRKRDYLYEEPDSQSVVKNNFIQIVTDKNDFLTENQRKQKMDKEKHDLEILQTKINFLEINSDLAQSIQRKYSVENKLDYISEQNSEL